MALYGGLAENTRRNERVERGLATFTGSTVITVPGPMRSITVAFIEQVIGTAPGVGPSVFTYTISGNQLTIFAWQPTSATNPTLVTGTSAATVSWMVFGSL